MFFKANTFNSRHTSSKALHILMRRAGNTIKYHHPAILLVLALSLCFLHHHSFLIPATQASHRKRVKIGSSKSCSLFPNLLAPATPLLMVASGCHRLVGPAMSKQDQFQLCCLFCFTHRWHTHLATMFCCLTPFILVQK